MFSTTKFARTDSDQGGELLPNTPYKVWGLSSDSAVKHTTARSCNFGFAIQHSFSGSGFRVWGARESAERVTLRIATTLLTTNM